MKDGVFVPQISVIIPVYNAQEYLSKCLNSVIMQDLSGIEILCIDDGSTDDSAKILQTFEQKDSRIYVYSQNNQGPASARNYALKIARGEYVAFLDSDDYYPEITTLRTLYNKASEMDANICGGSISFLRGGEIVPGVLNGENYSFHVEGFINYEDNQQDYYYQRFLYKKNFLIENKLSFPPLKRYQDPPFFVRAMILSGSFYAIPDSVYVYREGGGTALWDLERICDRLNGMFSVLEISKEKGLAKLHHATISRLEAFIKYCVNRTRFYENKNVIEWLIHIRNEVDNKLLQDNNFSVDLTWLDKYLKRLGLENIAVDFAKDVFDVAHPELRKPKISVIIPVFNVEKYLCECLDSVLKQTLREIEVICVNDGSTDKSLELLNEYKARDGRIITISQPNKGLSSARNTGIYFAHGRYIYFIDSDDYIDTGALEYLFLEAEKDALDILFFDGRSFKTNADGVDETINEKDVCKRTEEFCGIWEGKSLYVEFRKKGAYKPMVWLQLINRDFLTELRLNFIDGILYEDTVFTFEAIMKARRVGHRKKEFYHYRRRQGAITSDKVRFNNVYSRLLNYYVILGMTASNLTEENVRDATYPGLRWQRDEIFRLYNLCSDDEKKKTKNLSRFDKYLITSLEEFNIPEFAIPQEIESVEHIKNSASYRIGRSITFVPRLLRRQVKRLYGRIISGCLIKK